MPLPALAEPRRREFLAALGVPLFRTRLPLPGAAPSRPEPVQVDTLPATPVRPPLKPAVVVRPTPDVSAAPTRPASPTARPAASAIADPVFACRLLRVRDDLAVLLDLGRYPDLGPREAQLWQALCLAFDWQPVAVGMDFSWPVAPLSSRTSLLGRDAESARAMLEGWLSRDLTAGHRLLVLGEALADLVSRPHRRLPSLAELLASPVAKRLLWQTLSQDAGHA